MAAVIRSCSVPLQPLTRSSKQSCLTSDGWRSALTDAAPASVNQIDASKSGIHVDARCTATSDHIELLQLT